MIEFVKYFWDVLEPQTPLVQGWPLEAICLHLEAVTFGEIKRLLLNVPPGFMKSLLTDVLWPAWEWGPMDKPHLRYVTFSYASSLTERDNGRFRDLTTSTKYKELWGSRFEIRNVGVERVSNNKTGWKLASSVGGVATGERGDRIVLDDPHSVKESESETVRTETVRWFRESMSNRLNDMDKSAIVIIMQRVHEDDVSGALIAANMDYVWFMCPMHYDWQRHCQTSIGWDDPRGLDEEGEPLVLFDNEGTPYPRDEEAAKILDERQGALAWPERFSESVVENMERDLGPYAVAGQYEQSPVPRGGGLFKRDWWQLWNPEGGKWPSFDFLLASLDGAFTTKEENDPSAMTVWGVFKHPQTKQPSVMLVKAWRKWLSLHGDLDERQPNETHGEWYKRVKFWDNAGLCEWVAETCRFRDGKGVVVGTVDKLLIESKASGISVGQEMQRLYFDEGWSVELVDPKGDKVARAHSVVPTFSAGFVYAPDRDWADLVIMEMLNFPRGKYDDATDSSVQALKWLRVNGLIQRPEEVKADERERMRYRKKLAPIYPV